MSNRITILATALWIGVAGLGFSALARYESRPGPESRGPAHWPAESRLTRNAGRPTLIVFVHPYCPCTAATLANLDRLMARCGGRLDAVVAFAALPGLGDDWRAAGLWGTASGISGVRAVCDEGGVEAGWFGAATSGEAFLYDASGQLQFSGGLTASRGHEGDDSGCDAIAAAVLNAVPGQWITPVYGCSIFNQADRIPSNKALIP